MTKGYLLSLVAGLFLTACVNTETADTKRTTLRQMLAASAQVFVEREDGARRVGSAVVLSTKLDQANVAILTTAHLLEPPIAQSTFVVVNPQIERIAAEIVAIDAERDIALLAAPLPEVSQVELAPGAGLADEILIVAYPWGRQRTVVNGAVSQISVRASVDDPFSIWGPVGLVDATVSYGMSGGGVFDKHSGNVIGIVRGYRTAHLSLNSEQPPLKLPIAGETTVISTREIVCFLRSIKHEWLVGDALTSTIGERDCEPQS